MENFNNLKEFISIRKKSFLNDNIIIIEECGEYEPSLSEYILILDQNRLDGFKEYIQQSDIMDKEHTLRSLERIPAAVVRVMMNRINIESLTICFLNDYGGVQGIIDWYERTQNSSVKVDSSLLDKKEDPIEDSLFSEVVLKSEDEPLDEQNNYEKEVAEEDYSQYCVEKPVCDTFEKPILNNENDYKELLGMMKELQETTKYLTGTVNLLAAKNGLSVRDARFILDTNEILKVVASLRTYSDEQFRTIVEGVFLKAQSDEQRRVVSDVLGEILKFIEERAGGN